MRWALGNTRRISYKKTCANGQESPFRVRIPLFSGRKRRGKGEEKEERRTLENCWSFDEGSRDVVRRILGSCTPAREYSSSTWSIGSEEEQGDAKSAWRFDPDPMDLPGALRATFNLACGCQDGARTSATLPLVIHYSVPPMTLPQPSTTKTSVPVQPTDSKHPGKGGKERN